MSYIILKRGDTQILDSGKHDLYQYRTYVGQHNVQTSVRNSYWYLQNQAVVSQTGDNQILESSKLCVEIFGYTPETRTSTYSRLTDLPYINGCSTKQLITPNRSGDPTWQMLFIPEFTSEQSHHVHSTARIVYVHSGSGISYFGQKGNVEEVITVGDVLIIDKMVPHHFATQNEPLIVLPLHIYSSIDQEFNHPMHNGTHKI